MLSTPTCITFKGCPDLLPNYPFNPCKGESRLDLHASQRLQPLTDVVTCICITPVVLHHSTGRWKQTKYSTYLLLTCMKYLYHTRLHHCTGLWIQAIYNTLQLISVTDTCLYYTCILSLLYRPVKANCMRWVVLRTCNASVYGSVTGSLHPHPVTDQEIFCCVY